MTARRVLLPVARGRVLPLLFLLSAALGGAGCGGGDTTSPPEPANTHVSAAPLPKSGQINLLLAIDNDSSEEESNMRLALSFRRQGSGEAPWFAATVESIGALNGHRTEFSGGLVYASRRAVLEFEGRRYKLDPATLGGAKGVAACGRALRHTAPERLVRESDAGDSTEATGDLDVPVARRMLGELVQRSACGNQLQGLPSLSVVADDVEDALGDYRVESQVEAESAEDGTLRRLSLRLFLHPDQAGQDEYDGTLELTVTEGGAGTAISLPPAVLPAGALTKKLGADRAAELEAAARGFAGLAWAAIGVSG